MSMVRSCAVAALTLMTTVAPSSSFVARRDVGRWGAPRVNRAVAPASRRARPAQASLKMGMDAWLEDMSMNGDTNFDVGTLMFSIDEMMLPGQSRYLHLYEERFVQLFQDALENSAVFALGFFSSESEVLGVVTLVEIEEFQVLEIGVGVTIRAVTRGYVEEIAGVEPYVTTTCRLYEDDEGDVLKCTELEERLFTADEQLRDLEDECDISSKLFEEVEVDPRAFLLADGKQVDALDEEEAVEDDFFEDRPLRWRAREASAARMDSIGADDEELGEFVTRQRQVYLSFLGLENCGIEQKLEALLCQDTRKRLNMGIAATEDRINMVNMKRLLQTTLEEKLPGPKAEEKRSKADEVAVEPKAELDQETKEGGGSEDSSDKKRE